MFISRVKVPDSVIALHVAGHCSAQMIILEVA